MKEQAAEWLAALDSGSADPAAFAAWRAADPRHAAAFARIAHAWQELDQLRATRTAAPPLAQGMDRRSVLRISGAAVAAVVAGAVGLPLVNEAEAATGAGERRTVTLPDGSRAHLNTRTAISWRRWGSERHLWLDRGEVALDIAASEQPFTLTTGRSVSLDMGRYNARRDAEVLTLLPLQGRASVDGRMIHVGQSASVTENSATFVPMDAEARRDVMSWREGEIVFDGDTLTTAVAEFNRYLDRPLVIADPALARVRIGGRFQTGSPGAFLQALHDGFGVRVEDRGAGPTLLSAAPEKTPAD